jgi:hypothetical protein
VSPEREGEPEDVASPDDVPNGTFGLVAGLGWFNGAKRDRAWTEARKIRVA